MRCSPPADSEALALAARVDPKFQIVWRDKSPQTQAALARYFLPWRSKKAVLAPTRPRLIKWYCPFADQRQYPFGHRYCLNVYTGCSHGCLYCYAAAYEPTQPSAKLDFAAMLRRDLDDLERFDMPPAPLHISNSTDPLQAALEKRYGHCRLALEAALKYRHRFTTIVVLTKNPCQAAEYADLLRSLAILPPPHAAAPSFGKRPACLVELSLAFWRDKVRAFWEPSAPSIAARLEGWQQLREAKVAVALRLDPLFPRSPLGDSAPRSIADFGLMEMQSMEDLDNLIATARLNRAPYIIYSVAKICRPRGQPLAPAVRKLLACYRHLAGDMGLVWKGGSWRLPAAVAQPRIVAPFLELCRHRGMDARFCMQNLLATT